MTPISNLLKLMVENKASDLYITVGVEPMLRINGVLSPCVNEQLTDEDAINLAKSVMNEKEQKNFEETNEENLALDYNELGRFRVNVFKQKNQFMKIQKIL